MPSIRKFIVVLVAMMLAALLGVTAAAQNATAQVRFLHVIPGVSGLDIYINSNLSAANLSFSEATGYISAPAGELKVRVTLNGVTSTLFEQTITTAGDEAFTLIASSTDPLSFDVYRDDLNPLDLGTSRFNVIHAVKGGPALDFQADGQTIITGLAYKDFLNTIDVPANAYSFTAFPTGGSAETAVLPATQYGLTGRTAQTLVLYGPTNAPQAMVLRSPVQAAGEVGYLRVSHAAEDAPNVDLYLNDTLVVPALAFGETTVHIPVDVGSATASLRVAGGGSEVASLTLDVTAGSATTVAAVGTLSDLQVLAFPDDISGVTSRTAGVSVINAVAGTTVKATLADGTVLAEGLNVGQSSPVANLAPSRQNITLTIQSGEVSADTVVPNVSLYGGTYYNLIAVRVSGTFMLKVVPTGLAQTINSAPGASDELIVEIPRLRPRSRLKPWLLPWNRRPPPRSSPPQPVRPPAPRPPPASCLTRARICNCANTRHHRRVRSDSGRTERCSWSMAVKVRPSTS